MRAGPSTRLQRARGRARFAFGHGLHQTVQDRVLDSAGLSLHFNILGHRQDRLSGVPVHILAATVMEEAESIAHGQEIVRGTPVTSSGSLMLFTEHESALFDISPEGVFEVPSRVRTNHFLTEHLSPNEKTWLYQPDSTQRRDLLLHRLAQANPQTEKELLSLLVSSPEEAPLTCLPA